ncbi:MAG: hypothetical protein ACTSSP_00330 [Candidatus Asgardarchaeia archaeon]
MAEEQIWTTKDGRKIPVRKMTTEHLKNVIRFFDCDAGQGARNRSKIKMVREELLRRKQEVDGLDDWAENPESHEIESRFDILDL